MQPGMRVVVLATTFWLAVLVAGTAGHHPAGRLIFDQYSSPFAPRQYGVYRRAGGQPDWKDQDPVEKNHPFDPSINPPRSITNTDHEGQSQGGSKYVSAEPEDKTGDLGPKPADLLEERGKSVEDSSRFEESFVADDTFQDQGPGSLEIYKLDLLRERPLLQYNQVTPVFPGKGKSKAPKKTIGNPWKSAPKTIPGLPMLLHKQSNSFDDPSTEVPPDLFGVGGVPELQVGCEGLEAAHYKEKRSIGIKKDPWLDVTPITLDLDYEGELEEEEEEEEMDELLKLKKLETTTRGVKRNRGDMDAKLHSEFHSADDKGAEKLPVRGDLGRASNASDPRERGGGGGGGSLENGSSSRGNYRRILWAVDQEEEKEEREKRALWGFGENEGVVRSDELQTENQRRRMYQERRRKEEERRRANLDIERIRGEYERRLDERQREEEERQRRVQQSNRWQLEAEQRRQTLEEEGRRLEASRARSYQEQRRREEEEERRRRRKEEEEMDRRRLEERRREWSLKQRRIEEEEGRGEPSTNLTDLTAERERERKLDEYAERNRPIELAARHHHHHQQQQQQQRGPDPSMIDRRRKEEERKLLDYVRRNQPVHVARTNDSLSGERSLAEQRRRAEEVRRIYNPGNGRRNHGPSAPTNIDPRSYAEEGRRREAARRIEEEERRGRMREAERREEEVRRRMSRWYEEERRRKEAARLEAERMAKVQREEEARRSGGYEDRRRFDDHRRRQDTQGLIPANLVLNKSRRPVEHARQRQEEVERRRQEERRANEAREREERDRVMKEQWRRQEEARLNALPVSARIIVQPQKPKVIPRIGGFDIDFSGANPYQSGVRFPNFPAPPTRRPPVQSPPPCVWAIIQCCPSNQRLVTCFESLGCPGVNWDSNPCRDSVSQAARAQVEKFYRETEDEEEERY